MNHAVARRARRTYARRDGSVGRWVVREDACWVARSDEQVLARAAAEDAFSDARRSDSSRVATRESKRRPAVNSHESLIAVYDPAASYVPRVCLTIVPRAATSSSRHIHIDCARPGPSLINYAVYRPSCRRHSLDYCPT